ncbi:MAG: phosphatase [Oscillospiraceae bacterium]|jgi:hypothetical protein|nr:phosphatase [Oscillospiraceae bacterium]
MDEKILAEKAAEKRREYKRAWNARNRDKCRKHTHDYWMRKALREMEGNADDADHDNQ